jgi:hypothetical protein
METQTLETSSTKTNLTEASSTENPPMENPPTENTPKISEFSCSFGKPTINNNPSPTRTYSRRKYSHEIQLSETLKSIKPEIKTKLQKKLEDQLYFEGIERQKSEDRRFFDETHTDIVQTRRQRNKRSSVKKPEKKRSKSDNTQDSAIGGTQSSEQTSAQNSTQKNTQNSTQNVCDHIKNDQNQVSGDATRKLLATRTAQQLEQMHSKLKKNPHLSNLFKPSLPNALETSLFDQDPLSSSILPISQPNSGPSSVVNLPISNSQTKSIENAESSQTSKKRRNLVITEDVLLIKFHRMLVNLYKKHKTSSLPFSTIYKNKFDGFTSKRYWLGRLRDLHVVKFDFEKQEISCLYELFDGEL